MKPNTRTTFKPKIYAKHKKMNQSPAQWRAEHKSFKDGKLPTLYSTRPAEITEESKEIVLHPKVDFSLAPKVPKTELQKLREEGKFLRAKERLDNRGSMFKLGVNRKDWNRTLDCGFK